MNTKKRYALIFALALLAGAALVAMSQAAPGAVPLAQGGAPAVVAYQGEVRVSGAPYSGDGYFKFSVVNAAGSVTYWSNDGTSTGGGEPTAAVGLVVSEGLFGVLLGDTALGGMTQALAADVFSQPDRYLRVWFSDDESTFDQLAPDTRIAAVPYALQAQEAADADTVDGLHASELETHYQNVVIVAKSGGDYASVQAAINSITSAAADNPYLVWVAPGVYSETVTMKPYVHLQGAGQEATVITSTASSSAWPPTQATLTLASDASLRDLTVGNSGTGERNVGLLATAGMARTLVADVTARAQGDGEYNYAILLTGSGTGVTLQQIIALGEGGSSNYGLYNRDGAATLRGGSFTARGGGSAYGIYNYGSATTLEAESVTALAENGTSGNYGLYNRNGAAATLHGGYFTARGGGSAYGIYNYSSATTLEAESVTALGEDGSSNYGLYNRDGAMATLRGGAFIARGGNSTRGIYTCDSGTGLKAERVTILGEGGVTTNRGLESSAGAVASVTQSVLEGAGNPVVTTGGGGPVTVSNSRLVGSVAAGNVTCVAVSRGTTFNANGCP